MIEENEEKDETLETLETPEISTPPEPLHPEIQNSISYHERQIQRLRKFSVPVTYFENLVKNLDPKPILTFSDWIDVIYLSYTIEDFKAEVPEIFRSLGSIGLHIETRPDLTKLSKSDLTYELESVEPYPDIRLNVCLALKGSKCRLVKVEDTSYVVQDGLYKLVCDDGDESENESENDNSESDSEN